MPHAGRKDVEGFEQDVLRGADTLLGAGVLGVEAESNFGISPTYPKGHFVTLHEMLLQHRLLVLDIGMNRIRRASFQRALVGMVCAIWFLLAAPRQIPTALGRLEPDADGNVALNDTDASGGD